MLEIQIAAVHPKMGSPEMPWPARKSAQAAGWDCCAAIDEPLMVRPGQLVVVPLGFALALPDGWEAQLRPRSGMASAGMAMPNSPGTIDADYRGEVKAILFLLEMAWAAGEDPPEKQPGPWTIRPGDRVAQMVISAVPDVEWVPVQRDSLPPSGRGAGGFGSTGG